MKISDRYEEIAIMRVHGVPARELAERFGLSMGRINQICKKIKNANYLWHCKAKIKRVPPRPIDMGGPRDVWIENLPHENL